MRVVERALNFRREVQRLRGESDSGSFDIWQPEQIDEAQCWPLWHDDNGYGFGCADCDNRYIDPI